jgi:hypothetical protein
LISIFRTSDYVEAQLVAGLLRERGIKVFVQGELLQGGIGDLPVTGHLAIMVEEDDRSAARRIIDAYERGEFAIDDDHVEDA